MFRTEAEKVTASRSEFDAWSLEFDAWSLTFGVCRLEFEVRRLARPELNGRGRCAHAAEILLA